MSTRWPDKRLVGRGEIELLWTDAPDCPGDDPSLVLDEQPDLLGVACAWLCIGVSALIIAAALVRWAWVVIAG